MTIAEAIELIGPAMPEPARGTWADFGAGRGTFTEALAGLLGKDGTVIAIDNDPNIIADLRRLASQATSARIEVVAGDIRKLDAISALRTQRLDGALFGNVLHYVPDQDHVLSSVRRCLKSPASIIVIEYDRRSASRWVPHPLPLEDLAIVARKAGLPEPVEVARRDSRYQGELYCAVMRCESSS
ncbi:MAG: class I SAM-dependent methyltransferase [Gemmatimonadota bacterium]